MNRAELKAKAKMQISPHSKTLCLITLVYFLVSIGIAFIAERIPLIGTVAVNIVIIPAMFLGYLRIFLRLADDTTPQVADLFSGFDDFWSTFKVTWLSTFFTFLWMLLLIVPGYIKAISYSMAPYILAENKGMSARECISRSKEMMKGHKMEYFILNLSFIGWMFLGALTLGIAYIWIMPYMEMTMVNFYNHIKPVTVADIPNE